MDSMRRHPRSRPSATGPGRRTARKTGRGGRACLAALLLAALSGCGVPRPAPSSAVDLDFATVPNLRRAREALEDRIALEREHVTALETQLAGLRKEEERSYAVFLEAEQDFQLLQSDLSGTQQDLSETEAELATLRGRVESTRQRVALMHDELRRLLDDLARLHGLHQEILALTERLGPAPGAAAGGTDGEGGEAGDADAGGDDGEGTPEEAGGGAGEGAGSDSGSDADGSGADDDPDVGDAGDGNDAPGA